ncbi:transporter substrate-binding domain-containing protein [Hansschlegelia plantiphila]|uniref:Amino acid ABC substrate-binding protein n=1 Tax=Hansschlegelia plantiphila TaxID=374655 RepID=A0A9W6MUF0_9HYPH|nr:transporter substrate-binding domain-containing protein [Hansschlegelia plantiphila]GLK66882.1 amino acid ABC substrate-binding protein [Hansschlegelia plantiphila]
MTTEPWRIGVLFSTTGVTANIERTQLNATLLAVDEINAAGGVLGREIRPIVCDGASDPRQSRALAERLTMSDGVRLLFGCYMSSVRKAVLPVIDGFRGALFYPTFYEGFEFSQQTIYTGAAPNQNAFQLAKYLLEKHGQRFLFVGSNYIYPYETNRIMSDFVVQSRGKVVDEIYLPLNADAGDLKRTIKRIGDLRPDVVFSTIVGQATAPFYAAYAEAGFSPATMPIASLTTSEADVVEMPAGVAEGHISAATFFATLGTPAARKFVSAYRLRFGADAPIPSAAEAAYFQTHLAAAALERAGTDDPRRVLAEVKEIEFDAPQGRVRIDADNHHTYLWPRVARLDSEGRFQIVWNPGVRVKPDPYCVSQRLDDWSADFVDPAPETRTGL